MQEIALSEVHGQALPVMAHQEQTHVHPYHILSIFRLACQCPEIERFIVGFVRSKKLFCEVGIAGKNCQGDLRCPALELIAGRSTCLIIHTVVFSQQVNQHLPEHELIFFRQPLDVEITGCELIEVKVHFSGRNVKTLLPEVVDAVEDAH